MCMGLLGSWSVLSIVGRGQGRRFVTDYGKLNKPVRAPPVGTSALGVGVARSHNVLDTYTIHV